MKITLVIPQNIDALVARKIIFTFEAVHVVDLKHEIFDRRVKTNAEADTLWKL